MKPSDFGDGLKTENWCVMPRAGTGSTLAIDVGPIYDDAGNCSRWSKPCATWTEQNAQQTLQQLATTLRCPHRRRQPEVSMKSCRSSGIGLAAKGI